MRVVVAGGSGFLGGHLVSALAERGDEVVVLTRRAPRPIHSRGFGSIRDVEWHPADPREGDTPFWQTMVDGAGAVINLTGASIGDGRWTKTRKATLRDSRVVPTRRLIDAVRQASNRPAVFLQSAGVGIYGTETEGAVDETFPPADDFLGRLGVEWEAQAQPAAALGCRLVVLRNGVVLGRDGGAIAKMAMPFRFFVGGRVATGRQYLSWIHRDDWVALVLWALDTPTVSGIVNATSPQPVTNAEFSRALGQALGRPSWMPVPALVLRLLFGEMADTVLIKGQRAVPRRALDLGFRFRHPEIREAMWSVFHD